MPTRPHFYERNSFRIMLIAALLFFPTMVGAFRALRSNKNDVAQWLPSQYDETKTFQWFRRHFAGEQFILVSWDGCTLDDDRLDLLVGKLVPKKVVAAEGDPPPVPAAGPLAAPQSYFKEVVTGKQTLERLTTEPINLSEDEALERLKGSLIGPDLNTTCVVFTLSDEGKQYLRQAVVAVRNAATRECNIPPDKLHMGGPPVDNVAIDEAGENSLYKLAGFAGLIGLGISWVCLRSFRLIVMVFSSGIYGAAASLAVVWWFGHYFFGHNVNAILLTMPSLVYVATISGAIHLSNYYRDELNQGGGLAGAPERAIKHAWLPLSLATLTTAVGLATLCYSELVPIQLFGLYSAIGVVVSVLLLFFFLPAAFQMFPLRAKTAAESAATVGANASHNGRRPVAARRWRLAGRIIIRRHAWVASACMLLLFACAWGMTRIETSVHLMRLFPPEAKILADYQWLETNLGELVPMEVVLRIDPNKCKLTFLEQMELVERVQKQLEQTPNVGSTLSAVTFAPKLPNPADFKSSGGLIGGLQRIALRNKYQLARKLYSKYLAEHRDEYIEGDYLAAEDGQDLWRISARVGALKDVDYGLFLTDIEQQVKPVLDDQKAKGVEGVQAIYTGLVPLIYKAQRSLLDGLVWGFVTDFILITVVMMIAVRDWSAGLILAAPSIFPAAMIFGLMGWMGIVVDIGTVMAPAVALGVTVDDVVHFMIQFRNGLKQGLSRRKSVMLAYKGCARAMYQSWGVIGLGLSVFALSPFTPTQRFGYLMVTLLTAALIGNLLLLPALLAGPLGALFGRRYTRQRHASTAASADESVGPAVPGGPAVASGAALSSGPGMRVHGAEARGADHSRRQRQGLS